MVRLLIGAFVGCALGLWVGYVIASRDDPYAWWRVEMGAINREQHFAAVLGLDVLLKLERGETDKVKSSVATQLAYYERHFRDYDAKSPDGAHVIPLIRAASEHYAILRQEMEKAAMPTPASTPLISN